MLQAMVNQNVQEALKKCQDTKKKKECKKTQKKINELIGTLNKHQSETENTINREINELKTKIKEVIHDLRKKKETEKRNIMEGHSSRLEQVETESQNVKIKQKLKEKLKSY
jgi:ElaB/YqjD/DUF883 family membrane-anchored ribosome-binding protein